MNRNKICSPQMFRPTCWRLAHFNDWKLALIRKVEVHFIRQGAKMLSSELHPWWPFKHTMAVLHGNNKYLCQKWMNWPDIFSSQIYISRNRDGRLPFLCLCCHFHWPLWCIIDSSNICTSPHSPLDVNFYICIIDCSNCWCTLTSQSLLRVL